MTGLLLLAACNNGQQEVVAIAVSDLHAQAVIPTEWIKGIDVSEARGAEAKGVAFKDVTGVVDRKSVV